jgi:hypothetical protein
VNSVQLGEDIHYVSHGTPYMVDGTQMFRSACRAAKVTEIDRVDRKCIGIMVMNPTGLLFHSLAAGGCLRDELPPLDKIVLGERSTYRGGTWHGANGCVDSGYSGNRYGEAIA